MELPFVLVAAVDRGRALRLFRDHWLHTKPVFLLVLGGNWFLCRVRDVLQRLAGMSIAIKRYGNRRPAL